MTTETDTLTTPDEKLVEPGDHERFAHYVRKDELEAAILDGRPCTALCGKQWLPQRDPAAFPVCPDCQTVWEAKADV